MSGKDQIIDQCYRDIAASWQALRPMSSMEYRKEQIPQFLIEIIGFSLDADITQLASAMNTSSLLSLPSSTADIAEAMSILSVEGQKELKDLAALAHKLHKKALTNDINTTSLSERKLLYDRIIQPAEAMNVSGAYALSLVASYHKTHISHQPKRKKTILGRNTFPWPFRIVLNVLTAEALLAHAKIILNISPNERVQVLLGTALRQYQTRYVGKGKMTFSGWLIPWRGYRCEDGFIELKKLCCRGEKRSGFLSYAGNLEN
jgi:hypothetical protein